MHEFQATWSRSFNSLQQRDPTTGYRTESEGKVLRFSWLWCGKKWFKPLCRLACPSFICLLSFPFLAPHSLFLTTAGIVITFPRHSFEINWLFLMSYFGRPVTAIARSSINSAVLPLCFMNPFLFLRDIWLWAMGHNPTSPLPWIFLWTERLPRAMTAIGRVFKLRANQSLFRSSHSPQWLVTTFAVLKHEQEWVMSWMCVNADTLTSWHLCYYPSQC